MMKREVKKYYSRSRINGLKQMKPRAWQELNFREVLSLRKYYPDTMMGKLLNKHQNARVYQTVFAVAPSQNKVPEYCVVYFEKGVEKSTFFSGRGAFVGGKRPNNAESFVHGVSRMLGLSASKPVHVHSKEY